MTDLDHRREANRDLRTYLTGKLRADGYGGLCGDGCGCALDDLMACETPMLDECGPGYLHLCRGCPHAGTDNACPIYDESSSDYCIGPTKDYPEARDENDRPEEE